MVLVEWLWGGRYGGTNITKPGFKKAQPDDDGGSSLLALEDMEHSLLLRNAGAFQSPDYPAPPMGPLGNVTSRKP